MFRPPDAVEALTIISLGAFASGSKDVVKGDALVVSSKTLPITPMATTINSRLYLFASLIYLFDFDLVFFISFVLILSCRIKMIKLFYDRNFLWKLVSLCKYFRKPPKAYLTGSYEV